MARLLLLMMAASMLAGCLQEQPTWYEDKCLRLGLKMGSPAFNDCVARDLEWINETKKRAVGEGGR